VLAGVGVGDRGRGGGPGCGVHITAPWRGRRLYARRGIRPVPDDESLFGRLGRGGAAGHDPDAGRQPRVLAFGAIGGYGRDELEPGPNRELGIILLRNRSSPEGHDSITDELLHHAAVASDDGAGELEVARE
jgi:hypothetical protein